MVCGGVWHAVGMDSEPSPERGRGVAPASGTQQVSEDKKTIEIADAVPSVRALEEPQKPKEGLAGKEKEPRRRTWARPRWRHGVGKAW